MCTQIFEYNTYMHTFRTKMRDGPTAMSIHDAGLAALKSHVALARLCLVRQGRDSGFEFCSNNLEIS